MYPARKPRCKTWNIIRTLSQPGKRLGKGDEKVDIPITHLILREGHLWGQKDVTIDMTCVERIEKKEY